MTDKREGGRRGGRGPIVREIEEEEGWSHNHGSLLYFGQFLCSAVPVNSCVRRLTLLQQKCIYT